MANRAVATRGVIVCGMATGDHLTRLPRGCGRQELAEAGFLSDFARVRELLAEALAEAEQADLAGQGACPRSARDGGTPSNINAELMSGHRASQRKRSTPRNACSATGSLACGRPADPRPRRHCSGSGWSTRCCIVTGRAPSYFAGIPSWLMRTTPTTSTCGRRYLEHVGFYFLVADEQPAEAVRHLQLLATSASSSVTRAASHLDRSRAGADGAFVSHRDRAIELLGRCPAGQGGRAAGSADRGHDTLREAEAAEYGTEDLDAKYEDSEQA